MLTPEDVQVLLQLKNKGWCIKKIATEMQLHRNTVLAVLTEEHFVDKTPCTIWATLLEEGVYLCHWRTMYHLLHTLNPDDLTRVVGVLDWEMATVGDPLMDLGTTLGYWVTAQDLPELQLFPFGPTTLPGTPSRAALVERYAARTGRDTSHILFYYIQGLFKIAVIIQQIYKRYKLGLTQDPRFAIFIEGVRLIFRVAAGAIARDSIEPASVSAGRA